MFHYERKIVAQYLSQVRIAAIRLFGPHLGLEEGFLSKVTLAAVKRAFRARARRYHPDLYHQAPPEELEKKRQRFVKMADAYQVLRAFVISGGGGSGTASPGAGAAGGHGPAKRR